MDFGLYMGATDFQTHVLERGPMMSHPMVDTIRESTICGWDVYPKIAGEWMVLSQNTHDGSVCMPKKMVTFTINRNPIHVSINLPLTYGSVMGKYISYRPMLIWRFPKCLGLLPKSSMFRRRNLCPSVTSWWRKNPSTMDIILINPRCWSYKPTER